MCNNKKLKKKIVNLYCYFVRKVLDIIKETKLN